jgi:hypothetical protein
MVKDVGRRLRRDTPDKELQQRDGVVTVCFMEVKGWMSWIWGCDCLDG